MTAPSSLNSALLIRGSFFLDVDIQDIFLVIQGQDK